MVGRPVRRRLFQVQNSRNPHRCHGDDSVWLHEDERRPPFGPDARDPYPEEPVGCGETEARSARAFQDLDLMSEGENLEVQRRARANQ